MGCSEIVVVEPDRRQSVEDARENLEAISAISGGRRVPCLIDIRRSPPLHAETRHFYAGERIATRLTAVAVLVSLSPVGRTMGNIYLRVAGSSLPMRLFEDKDAAIAWLRGFVA